MPRSSTVDVEAGVATQSAGDRRGRIFPDSFDSLELQLLPRAHLHGQDGNSSTSSHQHDIWLDRRYRTGVYDHRFSLGLPPPYSPRSTVAEEPPTLSELGACFFKSGFVLPLFWLAGAMLPLLKIPYTPRDPDEWDAMTVAERRERREDYRVDEIRWAERCIVAFICFAAIATIIALAVVVANRT